LGRIADLLFRKTVRKDIDKDRWSLDSPLGYWSPYDLFLLRHAVEQIAIFGEIGAAKSTGSGAWLLLNYLCSGMGGLFNAIKAGDADVLRGYLRMTGQSDRLIVVEPSTDPSKPPRWRCYLLKYALLPAGSTGSRVEQVVSVLMTMIEAAERGERGGAGQDKFWIRSVRQLLRNIVQICLAARGTVTMKMIHDAIMSAPTSAEQVANPEWQKTSFLYRLIEEAETRQAERGAREQSDYELAAVYALREFPGMPNDTRGSVIASYSVLADVLLRGDMADLFDSDTNFVPDLTFEGAVICLNLPPKRFGQAGIYAQAAFTYLWQLAAERRDLTRQPRPVWWFLDEAAELVCDYTPRFLATARSQKIASVLICQNLSNYFTAFGGESGRHQVEAILGNTGIKILHSNGHAVTNEWASKMISDEVQTRYSFHANSQRNGGGGGAESIGHKVLPTEFTMLRKGGPQNGFVTEAIVYQTGARFLANGEEPYLRTAFEQVIPGVTTRSF
jgi:hypothetical protein